MPDILITPANKDQQLAEHAAEIRRLGQLVAADISEIGRHLTECREIVGHGGWADWLDREFAWSDQTARNFIHVYELSKSKTVLNLSLPFSALYLLAAPSTPPEVQDEIIKRVEAGEKLKAGDVKAAIEAAKPPKSGTSSPGFDAACERAKRLGHEVRRCGDGYQLTDPEDGNGPAYYTSLASSIRT
jgi:Protein of unknown function (DUF3102)